MTRVKKKVRSVAGQKFVPIKQETRKRKDFDDPDSYESRKRRAQDKRKRHASVYARSQADSDASADTGTGKRRQPRLKRDPARVAERSRELMEQGGESTAPDQN